MTSGILGKDFLKAGDLKVETKNSGNVYSKIPLLAYIHRQNTD